MIDVGRKKMIIGYSSSLVVVMLLPVSYTSSDKTVRL
jgi:hypothetical protein